MTKTPHLQCTCEKCDNIDQMSSKLIGNQFSGIDSNLKKAMESMWCPFKNNLKEGRQFPDQNCVQRECQKCGIDQLKQKISYLQGTNLKKQVHWEEWMYKKLVKINTEWQMTLELKTYRFYWMSTLTKWKIYWNMYFLISGNTTSSNFYLKILKKEQ